MVAFGSRQGSREPSVAMMRTLSAASLAAYPIGALILALEADTLATSIVGYGFILLALIFYVPLIGTSLQRIVGGEVKSLDEFELRLRGQALGVSFAAFAALTLLLVLYAGIATDKTLWVPTTYDHFNGVFWGVFLYASVLPIAVLSWMVESTFTGE